MKLLFYTLISCTSFIISCTTNTKTIKRFRISDDFYFEGSRSAAFKQIGNAVPPLMANAIAQKIKELLCKTN